MFKLKLKDGTVFNVPSSRLYDTEIKIYSDDKTKLLEYETKLTDDNLSSYSLYDEHDNYITSFSDKTYIANSLHFGIDSACQIGIYNLKDIDKVEKEFLKVNQELNQIDDEIEQIKKVITNEVDTESMTLDEYKKYKIELSKNNLKEYLETHPITSICHNKDGEQYSITFEKQQLLSQTIILSMCSNICKFVESNNNNEEADDLTKQICQTFGLMVGANPVNLEYKPSWNATNKACTYDWTIDELQQLAFEMGNVVNPLVSKQQTIEENINSCETKNEVNNVDITFD